LQIAAYRKNTLKAAAIAKQVGLSHRSSAYPSQLSAGKPPRWFSRSIGGTPQSMATSQLARLMVKQNSIFAAS